MQPCESASARPVHDRLWLRAGVSVGLLLGLWLWIDTEALVALVPGFRVRFLLPAFAVGLLGIGLSVWKWKVILRTMGIRYSYVRLLRLFWIGTFLNNFLPGRTGGDLYRAYGLIREGSPGAETAVSVVADRVMNLFALVFIALVAFAVAGPDLPMISVHFSPTVGVLLAVAGLIVLALRWNAVGRLPLPAVMRRQIASGRAALSSLIADRRGLCAAALLAAAYQAAMVLGNYFIGLGLGIRLEVEHYFYLIPLTALVTMLPVTVNGFGLREGAFAFALGFLGVGSEAAVGLSLGMTACTIVLSLPGGLLHLTRPRLASERTIAEPAGGHGALISAPSAPRRPI